MGAKGPITLVGLADMVRTTHAYDAANRLRYEERAGRTTYLYDSAGNQVSKIVAAANRETRLWDYEQRARGVIQASGDRTTYTVDGDLRRVAERTATARTTLVYDGENVLAEIDEFGLTKARYTNRP